MSLSMEEVNFLKNYKRIYNVVQKALNTEYYRPIFNEIGIFEGKDFTYDDYKKIPILSKSTYREFKFKMIAAHMGKIDVEEYNKYGDDVYKKRKFLEMRGFSYKITSGSTGVPLEIIKSINDLNRDYISLQRYRKRLTSYDFAGQFLWIWPVNKITRKKLYPDDPVEKLIRINKYGYQYMLYEHSEENLHEIYEIMVGKKIEWVTVAPSVLVAFANYLNRNNLQFNELKYIECHSEKLHDWQKKIIEQQFGCIPISIYSSTEVQFMAGCCEENKFHVFQGACFIELIDNKFGMKEVVVTSLIYEDIPLIRYNLCDLANWSKEQNCTCMLNKAPALILTGIRSNDFFVSKDGNTIEPFLVTDSVLYICQKYHISLDLYKVHQVDYYKIVYYFAASIQKDVELEIKKYLENYYNELLGYSIAIEIKKETNFDKLVYEGNKFKYIESSVKR